MKHFPIFLAVLFLFSCQREKLETMTDPYREAMDLLEPHLTWHGGGVPDVQVASVHSAGEDGRRDSRWDEAHRGEAWMKVPAAAIAAHKAKLEAMPLQLAQRQGEEHSFYWRLRDRNHADVLRAVSMLRELGDAKSMAWVRELERNNTKLTFDVPGGFIRGKKGAVVIDTRNADDVRFRVYRVRGADDLMAVCKRIGEDFIFRDWRLGDGDTARQMAALIAFDTTERNQEKPDFPAPDFSGAEKVAEWTADLDLAATVQTEWDGYYEDEWWNQEPDAGIYDDWCHEHEFRLRYGYREIAERAVGLSAWRTAKRVEIPAEALAEAGAYVLEVEANGEKAYAPLLIDPLSMTLRRCRDGVLAVVGETEGEKPAAGAVIRADGMEGTAVADKSGVAFGKVSATGDKAIIAEKGGRYAIGGFGRVFRGIYDRGLWQDQYLMRAMWDVSMRNYSSPEPGNVFQDGLVAAAYTDRPIYRPGQEVGFKVILRQLAEGRESPLGDGFRAGDFERGTGLKLPVLGEPVIWAVLDPKGREVDRGELKLSEFGTAAGGITLGVETAHGLYSIRIGRGGKEYLITGVFEVADYRRANFEIALDGIPETVETETEGFPIRVKAATYYGDAISRTAVKVAIRGEGKWEAIAQADGETDEVGAVEITLALPDGLAPGDYRVMVEMTDTSGRTVTEKRSLRCLGGWTGYPKFAAIGKTFNTPVGEKSFKNGGWQVITDGGGKRHDVFVFGKGIVPKNASGKSAWVNLANYANHESLLHGQDWDRPSAFVPMPVTALFSRLEAKVGEDLELLVYHPGKDARRLVFTMEGRTVVDYEIVNLPATEDDYSVVRIPIRKRHVPNMYVQAQDIGVPPNLPEVAAEESIQELQLAQEAEAESEGTENPLWCRVEVSDPDAPPGGENLHVMVKSDREIYKPGEQAKVDIRVTGNDGKARDAEVSLAAVDAAVFAFAEGREPLLAARLLGGKPDRLFLPKPWRSSVGIYWSAEWADSARAVESLQRMAEAAQAAALDSQKSGDGKPAALRNFPEVAGPAPDDLLPVGHVPMGELRRDFRETAAWLPELRTGDDGEVTARFKLPDSLTGYRLSAVALTKESEIGTGRFGVSTRLPLRAQLFTPRFAMEGDKLELVATVDRDPVDSVQPLNLEWEIKRDGNWIKVDGKNETLSGDSLRSRLEVNFSKLGEFAVRIRAGDGVNSDGEERVFEVKPWGRERPLAFRGVLNGSKKIELPEGLVIRNISAKLGWKERIEVADSLEGLRTLLGFPYGCVEQTMSRFLPAVVARDAVRGTRFHLPEAIEKELPEYVEKGLERLYGFQREDGGWGWWKDGAADPRMTAYVLYGFARCEAGGIRVDGEAMEKAVAWMRLAIAEGRITGDALSEAWLALAIAGKADKAQLSARAGEILSGKFQHDDLCLYALACDAAGLDTAAQNLWKRAEVMRVGSNARSLAIRLSAQIAFDGTEEDCFSTAGALTDLRTGFGWGDTRSTSWAIDGLSRVIPKLPPAEKKPVDPASYATVGLDGIVRFDTRNAVSAREAGVGVGLVTNSYPVFTKQLLTEAKLLSLDSGGEANFSYTVELDAVQGGRHLEPTVGSIQLAREFRFKSGEALRGAVENGDVIEVVLKLHLDESAEYLLLESPRPAGFEFADDRLSGGAAGAVSNREFRDTHLAVFFDSLPAGDHELKYHLRAETAGLSRVLPAACEPMYDRAKRGESGSEELEVLYSVPGER